MYVCRCHWCLRCSTISANSKLSFVFFVMFIYFGLVTFWCLGITLKAYVNRNLSSHFRFRFVTFSLCHLRLIFHFVADKAFFSLLALQNRSLQNRKATISYARSDRNLYAFLLLPVRISCRGTNTHSKLCRLLFRQQRNWTSVKLNFNKCRRR